MQPIKREAYSPDSLQLLGSTLTCPMKLDFLSCTDGMVHVTVSYPSSHCSLVSFHGQLERDRLPIDAICKTWQNVEHGQEGMRIFCTLELSSLPLQRICECQVNTMKSTLISREKLVPVSMSNFILLCFDTRLVATILRSWFACQIRPGFPNLLAHSSIRVDQHI